MKKILVGFFGIFLVLGIVAGTGYALYSSSVRIEGAVFGTANTDLKIDAYFTGDGWVNEGNGLYTLDVEGGFLTRPLYPGEMDWGHIKLINSSDPSMPLKITGQLISHEGNWNVLKGELRMRVCPVADILSDPIEAECGSWLTLEQWNTAARAFPGNPLTTEQQYWVEVELPANVDPNTAGNTISNVTFTITGTQAL